MLLIIATATALGLSFCKIHLILLDQKLEKPNYRSRLGVRLFT